ncbi:MAG: hypothetical protein K2K22_03415, partial [Muribaculaceae bacterium]|nr:hypothetical protein [Muribaculaceae bacterium]
MRFTSFVVFLILASSALRAQSKADVTPLISDASQFVSGAGAYASNLIDGNASTVWHSTGSSVTVRLPYASEVRPDGGDFKRQPTTTVFHEVLVIPGERVDLIPYSDIWHRSSYLEDFYRFYDYMSDKAHPDVYFLFNPKMGAYSEDGIFGGRALGYVFGDRNYGTFDWNENPPSLRGPGGVASFYRPRTGDNDEYIDEYIAVTYKNLTMPT